MKPRAVAYGACELHRIAHRYWMFGFFLSLCIHLSMVGFTYLAGVSSQTLVPPRPFPPGGLPPIDRAIFIPGITPRSQAPGIVRSGRIGTPVPVACPIEDPYPTQGALAAGVEPVGGGVLGGGTGGEVTMPPEEEPPPFRPVQIEPRVLVSVTPEYPPLAQATGMEGKVWVKIWVDSGGKPRKAVVIKGEEVFNDAALAAAMKFVFRPAIMNDQPVSVWVAIPFVFKLR
jgi:protein TonB